MKTFKKLSCMLLALIMVLGCMSTAFAAAGPGVDTGTTDTGVYQEEAMFDIVIDESMEGHDYEAYQIFSNVLTVNETGMILTDVVWGSGITEAGQAKLIEKYCPDKADAQAKDVAEAIQNANDAQELAKFLVENNYLVEGSATKINYNSDAKNYSAKVPTGYYLICDETVSTDTENFVYSNYIVQVAGNVTMKPKADIPHVDKKVIDDDKDKVEATDYDIGDDVPFELTATLPSNYAEYEKYKLVFHDTQSAGFDTPTGFVVTVDGTPLTDGQYTLEIPGTDGCTFDLTIADLKDVAPSATSASTVVVTYNAKLNDKAVVGSAGNENKVKLEYSNNPTFTGEGEPPTGTTPEEKVVVFTFGVILNKVDEEMKPLSGAAFKLFKQTGGPDGEGVYTYTEGVELKEGTEFKFTGEDSGIYKIEETATPAGYNSIEPIFFRIDAEFDDTTHSCTKLTMTQCHEDGTPLGAGESTLLTFEVTLGAEYEDNDGYGSTDIINQSGLQLPETGGIGTTIFYTLGGILVLGALVLLVTKRRMKSEQ